MFDCIQFNRTFYSFGSSWKRKNCMGEDERILIRNFLHSARLPGEGCVSFESVHRVL